MKEFSLALGGGGARGLAHIHVLRALDDMGIKPVAIAGSSIGSIVGVAYASGMSGQHIQETFLATFADRRKVLAKFWKLRPNSLQAFTEFGSFGQFDVEKVLEIFLPADFPTSFEALEIPTKVTATDYHECKLKVIESGDAKRAIAASAAIPVVFRPITIDGQILVDGGMYNPLPFDLLDPATCTIAVDVVGLPIGAPGEIPKRMDMAFGSGQLLMQAITDLKLRQAPPDLFIRPKVDAFRVLDFLKVKEILEATAETYDETCRGLERLLNNELVKA